MTEAKALQASVRPKFGSFGVSCGTLANVSGLPGANPTPSHRKGSALDETGRATGDLAKLGMPLNATNDGGSAARIAAAAISRRSRVMHAGQ
jgi:hypothetical protein